MNSECLDYRLRTTNIRAIAIVTGVACSLLACAGRSGDSKFNALRAQAAQAATGGDDSKASDLFLAELAQGENFGSNDVRLPTALNDVAEYDEKSGHSEKCATMFERAKAICQDHLSLAKNPHLQLHGDDDRAWAREGIRSCFGSMRMNIGLGFYGPARDEYNDAKAYCALLGDTKSAANLDQTYAKLQSNTTSTDAAFNDAMDGKTDLAFRNTSQRTVAGKWLHRLQNESNADTHKMHEKDWLSLLDFTGKNFGTRDTEYRDIFKYAIKEYLRFGMLDQARELLEKDVQQYQYLDTLDPKSEDASPEDALYCKFVCIDYQFLAYIHIKQHNYKEAIPRLKKALSLTDRYRLQLVETCELHEMLGVAYRETGQFYDSLGEFRKALNSFVPQTDDPGRLVEFKANLSNAEKKMEATTNEPSTGRTSLGASQQATK